MDAIENDGPLAPTDRPRWWRQPKWRAFVAIGSTYLIIVFATTFSFIALPSIADEFGVTLRTVGWVVITESLLIAALLLPMGGVADTVGRKRVLVLGMVVFGVGSVSTGLAPSFALVIGARVVMAVGSALVQSVGTGMLTAVFPAGERGLALGAQTTAVALGSATAPLVGGLGLQVLPWNALFLLLVVPVALSLLAIRALIPIDSRGRADSGVRPDSARRAEPGHRFDYGGGALSALAVVALVLTINNPFGLSWVSPVVLAGAAAAALLLTAFVRRELRVDNPILELRMFGLSVFRNAVIVRVVGFVAATANLLLLPVYLLSVRGISSALAGVVLSVLAVGMGLAAQVSGRLYDRLGPRLPSIIGLVLQIGAGLALAFATESTSLWLIGLISFVAGVAMALWNVPNNSAMMGATPPSALGVGGAFTNVTRTVGNVIGQALLTAVVAGVMASRGFDIPLGDVSDTPGATAAFLDGWRLAYFIAAGTAAAALVFALFLPDHADHRHDPLTGR